MYLFFMISGFLFVSMASILFSFIYELFEVNEITSFIRPTNNSVYNNITISIIPLIIWTLIEMIVLSDNRLFALGFILNAFLNMSIIYVIRYGYKIITNKTSPIVDIISIIIAVLFGFLCNYLCLKVGAPYTINPLITIIIVAIFITVFVLIRKHPPKYEFFSGAN